MFRMTAGDTAFIPKGKIHGWRNVGDGIGRLRYIFSPALKIEQMFRDIHSANELGEMHKELLEKLAKDYPDQETVGSPL